MGNYSIPRVQMYDILTVAKVYNLIIDNETKSNSMHKYIY